MAAIRAAQGRLVLERDGQQTLLVKLGNGLFSNEEEGVAVGFVMEADGTTDCFMLDEAPYARVDPSSLRGPDSRQLREYEGTYLFEDGDTARVRVQGGELLVTFSCIGQERPCTALDESRFACRDGVFRFELPSAGAQRLLILGFVAATAIP